jgi:hypothetical protein
MPEVVTELLEAVESAKVEVAVVLLSGEWQHYDRDEQEQVAELVHTLDTVSRKFRELFDKALWKAQADGNLTYLSSVRKQSDSDTPRGRRPLSVEEKAANLFK